MLQKKYAFYDPATRNVLATIKIPFWVNEKILGHKHFIGYKIDFDIRKMKICTKTNSVVGRKPYLLWCLIVALAVASALFVFSAKANDLSGQGNVIILGNPNLPSAGDCIESAGGILIQGAGAPCGAGGAITLGTSVSATNPQRSGDSTTGLFSPAISTVAVSAAGTQQMTINAIGVGIGTTTPSTALEVNGNVTLTAGGGQTITTPGNSLKITQLGDLYGATSLTFENRNGLNGVLFANAGLQLVDFGFLDSAGNQNNIRSASGGTFTHGYNNTAGEMDFIMNTSSGSFTQPLFLGGASSQFYPITAQSGQVSINVVAPTNPNASLAVNGNVSIGSYAGANAPPSNGLIVSGNVGIGTATPRTSLDDGSNTDALILPIGTIAQRPSSPINGMLRYNSTSPVIEGYVNNSWQTLTTGGASSSINLGTSASATNPARSSDITTGLFSAATSTVSTSAGGTDILDIGAFGINVASGSIGIGTNMPSNAIGISGQLNQTIDTERQTTANTAGNNLSISVGGATSGATNKAGGNLILQSGIATGTATSQIQFNAAPANLTGTSDNSVQTIMTIGGSTAASIIGYTTPSVTTSATGLTGANTSIQSSTGGTVTFSTANPTAGNAGNIVITTNAGGVASGATSAGNNFSAAGGNITIGPGGGGAATDTGTLTNNAGSAGNMTFNGSRGGNATGGTGATNISGTGTALSFTSGPGGTATNSNATSNTSGAGGGILFVGGAGGTVVKGNAGNGSQIAFAAGAGGNSSTSGTAGNGGNIIMTVGAAGTGSGGSSSGNIGTFSLRQSFSATEIFMGTTGTISIGSGTTAASTEDVFGNLTIGTSYAGVNAAPTNGMIVVGSVGIGTSSPLAILDLSGNTGAEILPVGTTGQRPAGVNGMMRYNSTTATVEGYENNVWSSIPTPLYSVSGAASNNPHIVQASVALSAGNATVTLTNAAVFSGTNTYVCNGNDTGGSALAVSTQNQSASSFKVFGTLTDTVSIICIGN